MKLYRVTFALGSIKDLDHKPKVIISYYFVFYLAISRYSKDESPSGTQFFGPGMVLVRLLADAEDTTKGGTLHKKLQQAIEDR